MFTIAMDEQRCRVRGVFLSMSEQGAAAPTVLLELPAGDCIPGKAAYAFPHQQHGKRLAQCIGE